MTTVDLLSESVDPVEVRVVANAIGWAMFADGAETVEISAEQLDHCLRAAVTAIRHLDQHRSGSNRQVHVPFS